MKPMTTVDSTVLAFFFLLDSFGFACGQVPAWSVCSAMGLLATVCEIQLRIASLIVGRNFLCAYLLMWNTQMVLYRAN